MKNLYLLCLLMIIVALSSCQKGSDVTPSNQYFITATANGVTTQFNATDSAETSSANNLYALVMKATSQSASISLEMSDFVPLAAGTSYNMHGQEQQGHYNDMFYAPVITGQTYTTYNQAQNQNFSSTITEITSTYVKGTFSGDVYLYDTNQKITISNGTFYVPLSTKFSRKM